MAPNDDLKAQFEQGVAQLERVMSDIERAFTRLVVKVQGYWLELVRKSPIVAAAVAKVMMDISRKVLKVLGYIGAAVQKAPPVISLFIAGGRWLDEVQKPVSAMYERPANMARDLVDWRSPAALTYAAEVGFQQAAIQQAAENADSVAKWLAQIAQDNIDFVVESLKVLTDLAGKLTKAVADALPAVTIVVTLQVLADELGNLVTRLLDIGLKIAQRFGNAVKQALELKAQVNNQKAFPDGRWPQTVRHSETSALYR
jgi:hypothetical protein